MAYDPATGFRTLHPDEGQLIRDEVAPVVRLGPSERADILLRVCQSAIALLSAQTPEQRARTLAWRDPLPPDSEAILARLRGQHRRQR